MNGAILLIAAAGLVAFGTIRQGERLGGIGDTTTNRGQRVNLKYFSPDEFRQWWGQMNPELLQKLDAFRERWGAPVRISPASGALGRHDGITGTSQHNVDAWGEVRAVDVFPMVPAGRGGYAYISSRADRERAYQTARAVGFTGIGLYTDTSPGDMLHVDVRPQTNVATWSRIDGSYMDIGQAIA